MTLPAAVEGSPPPPSIRGAPRRRDATQATALLLAFSGALLGACTRGPGLLMPGVSDQAPRAPDHTVPAAPASAQLWEHTAELESFLLIDERQLPSRGHNPPHWSGRVKVNAVLEPVYRALGPSSAAEPGSVAVESHQTPDGQPGLQYGMVKHEAGFDSNGGDWEYLVMNAEGQVESRGALAFCARCHADAPQDHLFGPRAGSRQGAGLEASGGPSDGPALEPDEDAARAPAEDAPTGKGSPAGHHKAGKKKKDRH